MNLELGLVGGAEGPNMWWRCHLLMFTTRFHLNELVAGFQHIRVAKHSNMVSGVILALLQRRVGYHGHNKWDTQGTDMGIQ
jgi:hypothetical protein